MKPHVKPDRSQLIIFERNMLARDNSFKRKIHTNILEPVFNYIEDIAYWILLIAQPLGINIMEVFHQTETEGGSIQASAGTVYGHAVLKIYNTDNVLIDTAEADDVTLFTHRFEDLLPGDYYVTIEDTLSRIAYSVTTTINPYVPTP